MKFLNVIIYILFGIIFNNDYSKNMNINYVIDTNYIIYEKKLEEKEKIEEVFNENYDTITAYTAFCLGCSGITASGYDVRDTIYYFDQTYGNIRIVAADSSIPFGSVIRIDDSIVAIVLDRGGAISYSSSAQFDLLFETEQEAYTFGRKTCKVEILRYGY